MTKPPKKYLDSTDVRDLEEGFKKGRSPEELRKAEQVIQALGYVKRSQERKRPGPRKKTRVNPTDETLRRLVTTIRAVLGLPHDTPKLTALNILDQLLRVARGWLRENFFLTRHERLTLAAIVKKNKAADAPSVVTSAKLERNAGVREKTATAPTAAFGPPIRFAQPTRPRERTSPHNNNEKTRAESMIASAWTLL